MKWNWQQPGWPNFTYDKSALEPLEAEMLHGSGVLFCVMGRGRLLLLLLLRERGARSWSELHSNTTKNRGIHE